MSNHIKLLYENYAEIMRLLLILGRCDQVSFWHLRIFGDGSVTLYEDDKCQFTFEEGSIEELMDQMRREIDLLGGDHTLR